MIISARGTGKSWGIALLLARDATQFKDKFSALVTRQTYQGLTSCRGCHRYFAGLGTVYNSSTTQFQLGGSKHPLAAWSWHTSVQALNR